MRWLYHQPHPCTQQRIITVLADLCGKGPATGNSTPKHNPNTPKGRGSAQQTGCPELGYWCWPHKRAHCHIPRGREGAREREELSFVHICTVGWVRAFPHVDHDLPGRVWKGFQGWEPKTFLGAGAAVATLNHLHLPKAFEEQKPLQVQLGQLTAGPPGQEHRALTCRGTGQGQGTCPHKNTTQGTASSTSS